jgi:hypothetical protein
MNQPSLPDATATKVALSADELRILCDLLSGEKHVSAYRANLSEKDARTSPRDKSLFNEALLNKLTDCLRRMG